MKTFWTALFQARMWREYAQAFDGRPTRTGITAKWLTEIAKVTRAECMRRARVNAYLARRCNRHTSPLLP